MNPLPLLAREMIVASRRPITQHLKMGFGGGSMLVAVWALLVSTGAAGPKLFVVLATGAAVMALFTAIFVASDSLSRERREGTLGFLFLTDLNAGDIVDVDFDVPGICALSVGGWHTGWIVLANEYRAGDRAAFFPERSDLCIEPV